MTAPPRTHKVRKRPRISPLRYPGGKAALYPRLRQLIRDSGLAGGTYVEPYAGGAGAAMGLLVTGQIGQVVVNDLDVAIHAFWETLVNDPDYMLRRIDEVALSVSEWRDQREIYRNAGKVDSQLLGFATFYLNRTNHSGVLNAGPIGGLNQSGTYKIDARFNRKTLKERIRLISLYADKITVLAEDGVDVIERYCTDDSAFIYADPPYFEKAGSLYLNAFTSGDHRRLAQTLNDASVSPWLLTYDNVDQVDELYAQRTRKRFSLNYSARRVVVATEVAVFSDGLCAFSERWTS